MRLLVDAVGVRRGSAAIVVGNILAGWAQAAPGDRITVLGDGALDFDLPPGADIEHITVRNSLFGRIWAQSVGVRLACRRFGADALLSGLTASAFFGTPCPRAAIVYDLRHELRPAQFSRLRRLSRRVLYGWSFHGADALLCISERTRRDLLARRPQLREKASTALLGADHAQHWRADPGDQPDYVLAFGHFANKNVDRVLLAWARYTGAHPDGPRSIILRVCGLDEAARSAADARVARLGIGTRVELLSWVGDSDFESLFAGSAAVLFPSDFEGFGLPAVEALLLGVPVVVSSDPALLEVTDGHAIVAADDRPDTLAAALERALTRTAAETAAGAAHAATFSWQHTARVARSALVAAGAAE